MSGRRARFGRTAAAGAAVEDVPADGAELLAARETGFRLGRVEEQRAAGDVGGALEHGLCDLVGTGAGRLVGERVRAAITAIGELAAVVDHATDRVREGVGLRAVHHYMRDRGLALRAGAARLEVDCFGKAGQIAVLPGNRGFHHVRAIRLGTGVRSGELLGTGCGPSGRLCGPDGRECTDPRGNRLRQVLRQGSDERCRRCVSEGEQCDNAKCGARSDSQRAGPELFRVGFCRMAPGAVAIRSCCMSEMSPTGELAGDAGRWVSGCRVGAGGRVAWLKAHGSSSSRRHRQRATSNF